MTTSEPSTSDTQALRILHISDSHLSGDGSLHYGLVDTRAALQRVLDRAGELDAIDAVVASGDLSDDGSEASYRALRAAIEPWAAQRGAAVVYAMGNHDLRDGFETVLGEREGAKTVRGFRIVHLDSSVPGFGYGEMDASQLDRLRAQLAEPTENGTIVVLHHPPVPANTPLLAALELQHPETLLEACAGANGSAEGSSVRLILSGHYHHSLVVTAAGIPVVVAPGITNTTDALAPAGTERATIGAGFALIDLPASGGPVSGVPVSGRPVSGRPVTGGPVTGGPASAAPRVTFVSAPGPDDGTELFNLDATAIEQIARAAGPQK
ncbi:metallophosphoesterase [Rathayibacter soli]|uniref:metallophosphoesterase n=1 Tax=Rathayibacter soli TaxID=3144168 RepID=UPI0027E55CBC|nr:metallophosphoesterase [Glaciibacter superstes]